MAYVDLNPVRARIAEDIEQCDHTSIAKRLEENSTERLEQILRPLVSGLPCEDHKTSSLSITLRDYIETLRALVALERVASETTTAPSDRIQRWAKDVATLSKRQRAFGNQHQLKNWLGRHNMRALETPLA